MCQHDCSALWRKFQRSTTPRQLTNMSRRMRGIWQASHRWVTTHMNRLKKVLPQWTCSSFFSSKWVLLKQHTSSRKLRTAGTDSNAMLLDHVWLYSQTLPLLIWLASGTCLYKLAWSRHPFGFLSPADFQWKKINEWTVFTNRIFKLHSTFAK